jgi:YD repeat-containing protein
VGNRLSETALGGTVITYTYDIANRLTSVDGVTYTWDDNGNLLSDGVHSYAYDHANPLSLRSWGERTLDLGGPWPEHLHFRVQWTGGSVQTDLERDADELLP